MIANVSPLIAITVLRDYPNLRPPLLIPAEFLVTVTLAIATAAPLLI